MKLTNLIWVLALAGAAAACNSGPPITNKPAAPPPPTGGSNGGGGDGACTTDDNQAVYDNLVYTDCEGVTHMGDDASSAIGSDCIFGTTSPVICPAGSVPPLPGCGDESGEVLGCFPSCPPETIQAAADCVAACTQTATAEIAPPGLSDECVACTGATVACGAANCTNFCVNDTNDPLCIACRCEFGCTPAFDTCSGLPPDGDC